MSPLAFDKQGKPFAFQRRTKKLLVRLFRNPSARGTCCQVLDASGQLLYVEPENDYMEFRRAVGHVPGLYRLDQCDEDGNELDDAQPAYVSIDVARNAQGTDGAAAGDVNPLVIIQQMAAIQADVMKTMAAQQAALMAATAEILRAPYRPAPIAAAGPELRNADASNDEEDELDDEIDEEPQPESTLISVARVTMPNMAAQLGEFLYEKIFELMNKRKKTASAAAMPAAAAAASAAPAAAPTSVPTAEPDVMPPTVPVATAPVARQAHESVAHTAVSAPVPTQTNAPSLEQLEVAAPTATEVPAPAPASPVPTPAHMAHLVAIREGLDAKERAIAEAAIRKMTPQQLAHWLAELSDQSVEDATMMIRDLIAQIRQNTPTRNL